VLIRRAFSLVEVLVVVVILGIIAGLIVPQFANATDNARTVAAESALATVRGSIASFRTHAVIAGTDPYPTLNQLLTEGVVLTGELPVNPYSNLGGVIEVNASQAAARAVVNPHLAGWCYFVNNNSQPPQAVFYANTSVLTSRVNAQGELIPANEL
jgi:general secretion pathway protein G